MSWKKNKLYFTWQSIIYAKSWQHFVEIHTYKKDWLSSFAPMRNSVKDELPWISFKAQGILRDLVSPNFKIFEFGGGGSTLFFCQLAEHVVTVEDSENWFNKLKEFVRIKNISNWEGIWVESEKMTDATNLSYKNPADFVSRAKDMRGRSFEKYVRTIDRFPLNYFDLIIVDGRARPSCIHCSISHLKPGGYLVVDNTEREYYLAPFLNIIQNEFDIVFDDRYPTPYTPDFTKTTILRKKG